MNALAVAGLLWLHPMVTDGTIEVTGRPSIGIRHSFMLKQETFEVALGTGYQAVRGRYATPAGVIEVERVLTDVVHHYFRGTFPVSERHPLYMTMEYEIRTNFRRERGPYSREADWITGHPRMVGAQQVRYYFTWATRKAVARVGLSTTEVGLAVHARW